MFTPPASTFRTELAAMLRLSAPLALANLLQMAVYAIDVIFVARLGPEALAASSLAVAVFASMMWGFHGLVGGVAPLIAAELGKGRHALREVRRSVRMALWLSLGCGVLGAGLCLTAERLMLATGQPPAIAAQAGRFILLLSLSIVPTVAASVLRTFVSALGRPFYATAITALAILANTLGNWAFVFGHLGAPAMGLQGSALSTLLTALVVLAAYVLAIAADRRLRRYHLLGNWWRPEWVRLGEIARIGLPIALTVIAEGSLFNSAAFIMGRIGIAELAAHTVALQIAAFFFQIPFGIGQAATIRVGYHFGAGDPVAIGRAGRAALATTIGFQLFAVSIMLFAPRIAIGVYIDAATPANAAVVSLAVQYLAVGAAFQLFDGFQTVAAGALRGLQDTRMPMMIALGGYWLIGFTTCLALGLRTALAGVGVWIGLALGLVVVALLLLWRWHRRESLGLVSS
ncbi:MAG: MATE family efflux transporter [Sphingomonadales bacterium]|nr:MATE family efflux transporter [Sphingomonadales bacterium]